MKFFETIANGYRYMWGQTKLGWEKYGPKICTWSGTGGLVASGIFACVKTSDIHDLLQDTKKLVKESKEEVKNASEETKKDVKKKYRKAKIKKYGQIAMNYAGPAAGTLVSTGLIAYGQHKWDAKYTAMTGAVATLMKYRENVVKDLGVEADRKYMLGEETVKKLEEDASADIPEDEEDSEEVEDEDLKEALVKKEGNAFYFLYSKETCREWSPNLYLRINILESITNDLNRKMIGNGHIFLNEMRREFGPPNKMDVDAGAVYGRLWDPRNPENPKGGRLIDLGYKADKDFTEGRKDWCWIKFDVDDVPLAGRLNAKKEK